MDNKNIRQKCVCQHKHSVTYKLSDMYKLDKPILQKYLVAAGVHVTGYKHLYQFQALWALYSVDNSNIKPEPEIFKRVCLWVKMTVSQLLALLHEKGLDRSGNKWDHLEMLITHHTNCTGFSSKPDGKPTRPRASDDGIIAADMAHATRRKARSEKMVEVEQSRLDELADQDAVQRQLELERKKSIRREEKARLAKIAVGEAEKQQRKSIAKAEAARLAQAEQDRSAKVAALDTARLKEAAGKCLAKEEAERAEKQRLAVIAAEASRIDEAEMRVARLSKLAEAQQRMPADEKERKREAFRSAFRKLAKEIATNTDHMKVLNFTLATLLLYLEDKQDVKTLPTWSDCFPVASHQAIIALNKVKQLDIDFVNRLCTLPVSPDMGALLWFNSAYGGMFAPATGDLHIKSMPVEYTQYVLAKPLVELQNKFEAGMAKNVPQESITLYHGTNIACVQSIIHEGFRACLYDKVRGPGLYMGADMATSLHYALQPVHRAGKNIGVRIKDQTHGVLLVCEVVGRGRPLTMNPKFHVIQDLASVIIRYVILVPYNAYGAYGQLPYHHEPSLIAELTDAVGKIRQRQLHGLWRQKSI